MPNRVPMASSFAKSGTANTPKGKLVAKAESLTIVAANEGRVGLYIANPSSKEVWVCLGTPAVAKEGIWLKKEVGQVYISDYTGLVTCITTEGEGEISYAEV